MSSTLREGAAGGQGELASGWRLVLACMFGVGFGSIGFAAYAVGAFVDPLGEEFGWSRTQVQGAIAFGVGLGGFAAPIVGLLIDRYGGRRIALWGLVGVAIGYLLAAFSNGNLWLFYLAYAMVALLGAGSGPVSWTRAIAGRFERRRGIALALALSGTGISAIFVPPYVVHFIENYDWRVGYIALALLPLLVALPLAALFFHPSDYVPKPGEPSVEIAKTGVSLSQALRSYRFWVLLASILAMYLAITGIVPNMIPALTDKGFTPATAAATLSVYGFSLIAARLGIGWLLDRFWGPAIAAVVLTSPAAACVILLGEPSQAMAILASALIGAAAGAELDLLAYFAARYFGLRSYGRIYGLLYTGIAFGAGLGPIAFAYLYQITGTYDLSFQVALGLFCFGGLSILTLGRYPDSPALQAAH